MKRVLLNLPIIAVFFAAAYWPDSRFLDNLAVAAAYLVVGLGLFVAGSLFFLSAELLARAYERAYPNGKGRLVSA